MCYDTAVQTDPPAELYLRTQAKAISCPRPVSGECIQPPCRDVGQQTDAFLSPLSTFQMQMRSYVALVPQHLSGIVGIAPHPTTADDVEGGLNTTDGGLQQRRVLAPLLTAMLLIFLFFNLARSL